MPKLEYFLISESVSVDQRTNRLSIFNVIESVNTYKFPLIIPTLAAVVSLVKEEEDQLKDFQLLLKIYSPGDEKDAEFPINFNMTSERHRLLLSIENMQVKESGLIRFEVYLNGILLVTRTANVNLIPSPEK